MRKNNQGLTLIELVVTVAIIAIFSGVVLSIVSTTSNSFRTTSSTAKVQMETQELLDTIQDLVIDANRSVYYSYGASGSSTGTGIENDIDQDAGDAASVRSFYVCNVKEISGSEERCMYDVLQWDPVTQKLTYSYHEYKQQKSDTAENDENGAQTAAFFDGSITDGQDAAAAAFLSDDNVVPAAESSSTGESILAENVVTFRADTTKVQSQYIVRFRITLNERGKEITTLHTVNLRNKIKVAPPDQAFPEATVQPVSVKIVEAPSTVKVGEGGRIVAKGFGFSGNEDYVWSVDDTDVAIIEGNGKEYQLVPKKAGTVRVTVTATDTDGRADSDYVDILVTEEENKLDSLIISGLEIVASMRAGSPVYDLRSYIQGYSKGTLLSDPGNLVWKCDREDIISISGDNLTVKSDSWNKEGPLGTFQLWAVSSDVPEVQSAPVTVAIARIKIINPLDGAVFDSGQNISVEVEYYVGNTKTENYNLYINDESVNSSFDIQAGTYSIRAQGKERNVLVEDKIIINASHVYGIVGSDVMAATVAESGENQDKGYICNQDPSGINSDSIGARMYWLADETGSFVQAEQWEIIPGEDSITFQAVYNGSQYMKTVNVEDIYITKPSDSSLIADSRLSYTCEAKTTSENNNTDFSWSAINGTVTGNQLTASKTDVTLTATTDVVMCNPKFDYAFPVSDSKDYPVLRYQLWGSAVMPDTVAQISDDAALKYICNQNPAGISDPQVGARMYWLGDQNGNYVQAENWSTEFSDGEIIFTASVTVHETVLTFAKKVKIVSVTITQPSNQLLVNGDTYTCNASLTHAVMSSDYIWSVTGGSVNGDQLIVNSLSSVNLSVNTNIYMDNGKFLYSYPVTDDKLFYTVEKAQDVNKWTLEITSVGENNTGIINIPAKLTDTKATPVSAIIINPGGKEHSATTTSSYTWSLFIPALNTTFTNDSTGFSFPDKNIGNITITNWTFPESVNVKSLPGVLTLLCNTSNGGKPLALKRQVLCVVAE